MAEREPSLTAPEVWVDVIVPVHNASSTLDETILSAIDQRIPEHLKPQIGCLHIAICCYNDGSTDDSWDKLIKLKDLCVSRQKEKNDDFLRIQMILGRGTVARGAGYARNRAVELISTIETGGVDVSTHRRFLCMLDSDDKMHPHRVAEQVCAMLRLTDDKKHLTLLGSQFDRTPPDSTWHYAQWANGLTDERLLLEQFRECTLLQPTWMMSRKRFEELGGYVEAPTPVTLPTEADYSNELATKANRKICGPETPLNDGQSRAILVHPTFDTSSSLRLAEDLRFFYSHLCCGGALRLLRQRLLTYRHREGMSQSSQTPRKLLLHLRVLAFERMVLERDWADKCNGKFVVWGAGRDGKDFVKALSTSDARKRVACFVDVDFNKIKGGYYVNKELQLRIPIVHFSLLATDPEKQQELLEQSFSIGDANFGRINKGRNQVSKATDHTNRKKSRIQPKASYARDFDTSILPSLPVVVCVAMYRTSGALERNVAGIGRTEGKDLWHFS